MALLMQRVMTAPASHSYRRQPFAAAVMLGRSRRTTIESAAAPAAAGCCCRIVRAGQLAAEGPMSASAIAQVVNWAYRGKYVEGDARAWTGERHLLAGVRTTAADIASLVQRTNAAGSREVMLLALSDDGGQPTPGLPLEPPTMALLGTVHVQCLGVHPPACEAGMFSVDPDRQSAGVGGQLLAAAEQAAVDLGARSVVLHVLEGRDELQDWYERCGYAVVPSAPMVPFPVDAGCGVPRVPAETLRFLRMEKPVVQQPSS